MPHAKGDAFCLITRLAITSPETVKSDSLRGCCPRGIRRCAGLQPAHQGPPFLQAHRQRHHSVLAKGQIKTSDGMRRKQWLNTNITHCSSFTGAGHTHFSLNVSGTTCNCTCSDRECWHPQLYRTSALPEQWEGSFYW